MDQEFATKLHNFPKTAYTVLNSAHTHTHTHTQQHVLSVCHPFSASSEASLPSLEMGVWYCVPKIPTD